MKKKIEQQAIFCLFFILLGVFARVFLFAQNFDLTPDDASLSASIWQTNFSDIFAGLLPFNQNAPLGFLLSVKILAHIFDSSELILRLIPFIAGVLLLPLAYKFAVKEFNEKFACVFLFFIVCSDPLLFYSIQFKQYTVEAFIALFLIYKRENCTSWRFILLAIVSILFSSTAPLILASIYITHIIFAPKIWQSMLLKLLVLASFSGFYYFLWLNQLGGKSFMQNFWGAFWFPNLNFIQFIGRHFINFTPHITQHDPFVYLYAALTIILTLFGFYFLLKENKKLGVIILLTLFLVLLLYFLKIYPLGMPLDPILNQTENFAMAQVVGSRLIVYFIPIISIAIAFSLYKILNALNSKFVLFILLAVLSLSPNISRMQMGLGIAEYSTLLEKIKPYTTSETPILVSAFNSVLHLYYQRKNLQNDYFSMHYHVGQIVYVNPSQSTSDGYLFFPQINNFHDLFSALKSLDVNRAIFLFANYDHYQTQAFKFLPDYLKENNHTWLMIPTKNAAAVIVDF
ncbi:MAG: hypothetical protein LBC85_06540 [Fibromonadaceae bacterium]|jgi:hypothetical protein|nr:hypothetical protein [Fibromonadaceae bacterium]